MTQVLDLCFGERQKINFNEFSSITERDTSDMVLAVLSLLRERLPCSENYWRYKRHYEMHMRILAGDKQQQDGNDSQMGQGNNLMDEECKSDGGGAVKRLAKAHMSFVKPLSPYNRGGDGQIFKMLGQSDGSGSRSASPNNQFGDVPMS